MGLSFKDQCNTKIYFTLSHIEKERMEEYGLNMTVKELQEKARRTLPAGEVYTGNKIISQQQKATKFWSYEDFKETV